MVQKTSETILHLATPGGVILMGHGSNIVTAGLDNVFRVRRVGSPERRVERVMRRYELNRKESLSFMAREDKGGELR